MTMPAATTGIIHIEMLCILTRSSAVVSIGTKVPPMGTLTGTKVKSVILSGPGPPIILLEPVTGLMVKITSSLPKPGPEAKIVPSLLTPRPAGLRPVTTIVKMDASFGFNVSKAPRLPPASECAKSVPSGANAIGIRSAPPLKIIPFSVATPVDLSMVTSAVSPPAFSTITAYSIFSLYCFHLTSTDGI